MTPDQPKPSLNELPQVYDSSLKTWVSEQVPEILPVLLPGAEYEATLDNEIIRPTMRVDKVFKILYHRKDYIFHLEFEAKYDQYLKQRLLVYKERLSMFDQLFEESPMIQAQREKGRQEGEFQAFQRMLVTFVRTRYPDLTELAQQQASHFDNSSALEHLYQQVLAAPDASIVRWLLTSGIK